MRAAASRSRLFSVVLLALLLLGASLRTEGREEEEEEEEYELPDELPAVVRDEMERAKLRGRAPAPRVAADGAAEGAAGGARRADVEPEGMWSEVVSWSPRLLHLHNVLGPEEIAHLIALGEAQMERSTVVGAGGKSVVDRVRTSKGTFLQRLHDPIVKRIEQRIARVRGGGGPLSPLLPGGFR